MSDLYRSRTLKGAVAGAVERGILSFLSLVLKRPCACKVLILMKSQVSCITGVIGSNKDPRRSVIYPKELDSARSEFLQRS